MNDCIGGEEHKMCVYVHIHISNDQICTQIDTYPYVYFVALL